MRRAPKSDASLDDGNFCACGQKRGRAEAARRKKQKHLIIPSNSQHLILFDTNCLYKNFFTSDPEDRTDRRKARRRSQQSTEKLLEREKVFAALLALNFCWCASTWCLRLGKLKYKLGIFC